MSPTSMITTTKLLTIRSIIFVGGIGSIYLIAAAFLMNYHLVTNTLEGTFPLTYKTTLLGDLIVGMFGAIGWVDSLLLSLIAFFVGCNLLLIVQTVRTLEGMGKVKFSIGGVTLISLVTAGCGACGFTVFSLLGVTTSLSFLPFHGLEIHIISLLILVFSARYMVKKLTAAKVCTLY